MAKRVKDSTKKSAGKAVKIGALKFTAFLSPFLITVIILILTFFIGSSIISNVAELFEAKNTPEKIYDMLEIAADEDLSKLVEVKDDGKGGYYLGFVDGFDKKIDKIVEELDKTPGVHNVTNDREFLIKLIEAELVTKFPDLGGTVPKNTDGFQGATKLTRITPNKALGEMKNTGTGSTTVVEEEEEEDLHASKSEEKKVKEWKKGDKLVVLNTTYVYEQTESKINPGSDTKHWDKVLDNTVSNYKRVYKDEVVTYTGTYKEGVNPSTDEVTLYAEVERKIEETDSKKDEKETIFLRVFSLEKKEKNEASIDIQNDGTKKIAGNIINVADKETDSKDEKTAGKTGQTYTIAIAAGHNSTDNSGASNSALGLKEEELTVQVSEMVEDLLSIYSNIKVVQTGSTSSNRSGIKKSDRTRLAREAKPDLCIQVHIDAGGGSGVSTFYKVGDNISQQLGEILANSMSKAMGIKNRGCMDETHTGVQSLGIIESSASSGFPSIVTEGGFIDGSPDQEMFKNGEGVKKYAQGIVDGILEYLKVDHQGYGATTSRDESYTDDIESKAIVLKYVSNETFDSYVNNNNQEAIKVFTIREGKVITATWSYNEGQIDIKENTEIDLQTTLQKYTVPYEYLLYFYINSGEKDFSMDLAEKILKSKIIMAVKDNITTTSTTTIQEQKRVSDDPSQDYDWTEVSRNGPTITESVNTSTGLIYANTWCVKVYQENEYYKKILKMNPGDEKIITAKGRVTESSGASNSGESSSSFSWTVETEEGGTITYSGIIYSRTRTETRTISHQYGSEDLKTSPQEGKFVKLYKKHDMAQVVNTYKLFIIMGDSNDDEGEDIVDQTTDKDKEDKDAKKKRTNRTANLVDLTKYLIYMATGESYDGVIEYDFSEFIDVDNNDFNIIDGDFGDWDGTGSNEDFIKAVAPYAVIDMEQHHVYASVTITQAIWESGWGHDDICIKYKNFFGMKAFNGQATNEYWTGDKVLLNASEGGQAYFRVYDSLKNSVYDHGVKLYSQDCYVKAGVKDAYEQKLGPLEQLKRLQNGGYSTSSSYVSSLWGTIQKYNLTQYDNMSSSDFVSNGSSSEGEKIVEIAKSKLGCPYVWGATGPDSFDCSGLVYWVYQQVGITVPRSTSQYSPYIGGSKEVSWDKAQPGDILLTNGHAGLYIGNNQYIHSPQPGDVVKIANNAKSAFQHVFRFYTASSTTQGNANKSGWTKKGVSVPLYPQSNQSWSGTTYGNTNIANAGCGACALAMAVSGLTSSNVTPDQIANAIKSNGITPTYAGGGGVACSSFIAKKYGLSYQQISGGWSALSSSERSAVDRALKSGKVIVTSTGCTSEGHYILIYGTDGNGGYYVTDSAKNGGVFARDTLHSYSRVFGSIHQGLFVLGRK